MAERTRYQEKVIRNYYQHQEAISVQRLQELATELYLCSGKTAEQHWKRLRPHLEKLGVPPDRIEHIMQKKDPAMVAKLATELFSK